MNNQVDLINESEGTLLRDFVSTLKSFHQPNYLVDRMNEDVDVPLPGINHSIKAIINDRTVMSYINSINNTSYYHLIPIHYTTRYSIELEGRVYHVSCRTSVHRIIHVVILDSYVQKAKKQSSLPVVPSNYTVPGQISKFQTATPTSNWESKDGLTRKSDIIEGRGSSSTHISDRSPHLPLINQEEHFSSIVQAYIDGFKGYVDLDSHASKEPGRWYHKLYNNLCSYIFRPLVSIFNVFSNVTLSDIVGHDIVQHGPKRTWPLAPGGSYNPSFFQGDIKIISVTLEPMAGYDGIVGKLEAHLLDPRNANS